MIADRNGRILARVRVSCLDCPSCDEHNLIPVFLALAHANSILEVAGVTHVNGPNYSMAVGGARLEFVWSDRFASDLNLICP